MTANRGKQRLDQRLVDLGLVESRTRAQALIRAGEVIVDGRRVDKPGTAVPVDAGVRLVAGSRDVSRGAAKLRGALQSFPIEIQGKLAADLGASTGGFTQVLLERGARRVETFDVGYGLLHERLRKDDRVRVHDRTNVRYLTGDEMEPAEVVVIDLSFIGLEKILPAVRKISHPQADIIALVKPQFEAGKHQVGKGGIVRKKEVLVEVLERHLQTLNEHGFQCWGLVPSGVQGKKGNQEFLSWFRSTGSEGSPPDPPDPRQIVC